jgi:hypothetical protein
VQAAARVTSISNTGDTLTIGMPMADMVLWPKTPTTVGRAVLLRVRLASLVGTSPPTMGLTVTAVDPSGPTIQVSAPAGTGAALVAKYQTDGILVLPSTTNPTIVSPAMIAALSGGALNPTSSGSGCTTSTANNAPPLPSTIPHVSQGNSYIAAFESGDNFTCGAIHPAFDCKMRTVADDVSILPVDFCFVCRYTIVETVDAGSHGYLDSDFPK